MTVAGQKGRVKPPRADETQPWMGLVKRNMPLVKYVLGKISSNLPPCVDRDDLLAAGSMGLIESARRFDDSRGVPFHSYAIPRIWGSMLDELRKHDWLSNEMREQITRMEKSIETLRSRGCTHPGVEEIAQEMGCDAGRVAKLMTASRSAQRKSGLDAHLTETAGTGLRGQLGTSAPRDPYEEAEFQDRKQVLIKAIEELPEREKKVIVFRYNEGLYLHEIGKLLDVSESRVCQIHTQALRRLKKALGRAGLSP